MKKETSITKTAEEMLNYIKKMATRQMRTHHSFDEAIKRWEKEINDTKPKALKLTGFMVSGDVCDLSGHPNPEY